MITVSSSPVKQSRNEAQTYAFQLNAGGGGTIKIVDPLLRNPEIAELRARSELLENGYRKKYISFNTYRTDIRLNSIIRVNGLKYKVTEISVKITDLDTSINITGLRYE